MKSFVYFCSILVFTVVLAGVFIYKNFYYGEKKSTSEKIDNYLRENNYQQQILKKEILFDKTGEYFARVVFKDEPNNDYEIYVSGNKFEVDGYKNGEEIVDKKEGKYITEY